MYARKTGNHLPGLMLLLGAAAMGLRKLLYLLATDEKGLLVFAHPLEIALWCLTAAVMLYLLFSLRGLRGSRVYEDNFSASIPAALGQTAAAAGFFVTGLSTRGSIPDVLGRAWNILGILCGPCLLLSAWFRFRGRKPSFVLSMVPSVFLVLHIINHYPSWSSQPQLMDYAFALFGAVALTLFAFYTSAFCVDIPHRRMQIGTGLAAVYFCLAGLLPGDYPLLYLGGALWALTDLCTLDPKPVREGEDRL